MTNPKSQCQEDALDARDAELQQKRNLEATVWATRGSFSFHMSYTYVVWFKYNMRQESPSVELYIIFVIYISQDFRDFFEQVLQLPHLSVGSSGGEARSYGSCSRCEGDRGEPFSSKSPCICMIFPYISSPKAFLKTLLLFFHHGYFRAFDSCQFRRCWLGSLWNSENMPKPHDLPGPCRASRRGRTISWHVSGV